MADAVARQYSSLLPLHCKGRLVDLGCGKAPLFECYRDHVSEVYCVDWPSTPHGQDYLDWGCDLAQPLPIRDASFDTVILSDVLEHVPNPAGLCMEISRILRPAGKILLNTPFYHWIHEEPHDYYRYTEFALRRLLTQAGLNVVLLESVGGAPEALADILANTVLAWRPRGWTVARLTQKFVAWLLETGPGERWSQQTRAIFPLGYIAVASKDTVLIGREGPASDPVPA